MINYFSCSSLYNNVTKVTTSLSLPFAIIAITKVNGELSCATKCAIYGDRHGSNGSHYTAPRKQIPAKDIHIEL